jgi:drug/metabolite transporter (DMT)-like permease
VVGLLQILRVIDLSPPRSLALMTPGLAAAVLSVIAFVALTLGLRGGEPAIAVVLSSLTSAVTVVLARVITQARMAWHQWSAIVSIVVGLVLMKW